MGPEIHTSPIFWAIIIGYFVIILGFGSYFSKYNQTTSDFFFSGRRFSWWLITMSIVATGVGSHSFLKYSAKAYQYGFSSTMTYMNDWFFMPFFLFGWLPIVYYTRIQSIPDYLERRFNKVTRILATIAILGYMIGYIAIGFLTMGKTLEPILGWNLHVIVWVVALVAGIYITFGGQTAVIFTDLAQGFILLFAGLLILGLGLQHVGGFHRFWSALPAEFKLPLADFNKPSDFNFVGIFWQDGVAGSIGFLFMNQGLVMRFMATKSVDEGRKAAAFNVLVLLPISTIVVSNAGWIGRAIANLMPGEWNPAIKPDHVFTEVAYLISHSQAVFAFLIAAVAAALMSTVDTLINAVAAVTINDIYRPLLPNRSDKHYLRAAMGVSALATILGAVSVTFFMKFPTLYEAHAFFHSTMTPPLVVAIFLGIFWKRYTTPAAIATFVGGATLMWLGNHYPEIFIKPFSHGIAMDPDHPYTYIRALYNTFVCLAVAVVATYLTKPPKEEKLQGFTAWTLQKAREHFKGGPTNDREGEKVLLNWREDATLPSSGARFSKKDMERMAAEEGDLVYISDKRAWMGGLKSVHTRYLAPHDEEGVVYVSPDLVKSARFVPGKLLIAEKEM